MKKYIIIYFLAMIFILSACGENEETTTKEVSTKATTEATTIEETTEASVQTNSQKPEGSELTYEQYMYADATDYPDDVSNNIKALTVANYEGTFTVICEIKDSGLMAKTAEYITQSSATIGKDFDKFDILISYEGATGWICSWHSYDNKTGILINTLTDYKEENVSIDRLYEWNNGDAQ